MNVETFCEQFATFADAPNGVELLREMIFKLAVQGKLVPQESDDELAVDDSCVEDYLSIQNGYAFKSEWFVPNGVRLVRNVNVGHDELRWDDLACVSEERAQEFSRFELKEGDIVISLDRPLISTGLKVARLTKDDLPALLLQRVGRPLFKDSRVTPEYFFMWLKSPDFTKSIDPGKSNGVPHIAAKDIHRIRFTAPSPKTQKRIVAKVDKLLALCDELSARQAARREARERLVGATLDRLVSSRSSAEFPTHAKRLRDNFDRLFDTPTTIPQLRQTMLQLAVQGQFTVAWRKNNGSNDSAADFLKQIIATRHLRWIAKRPSDTARKYPEPIGFDTNNLPSIPDSWKWTSADSICEQITDGEHIQPPYHTTGFPMLSAKHVRDGFVTVEGAGLIAESDFRKAIARCEPRNGDILIVSVGATTGRAAIIRDCPRFAIVRSALLLKPLISGEYLLRWLQSPWCLTWMTHASGASAQAHLYIKDTKRMPVPIPPLAEQVQIVSKLTELMSLCDYLESKLTQAGSASSELLSAAVHNLLQVS